MEWPPGYGTGQVSEKVYCTKCKRKLEPTYSRPQCDALLEPVREVPEYGFVVYVVNIECNGISPVEFSPQSRHHISPLIKAC